MPLQQCSVGGKSGWQWGSQGKCYTGKQGKRLAIRQALAIGGGNLGEPLTANAPNPLRMDPTRTATLRRKFLTELRRRFNRIDAKMRELIVKEDAFGLKDHGYTVTQNTLGVNDGEKYTSHLNNSNGDSLPSYGGIQLPNISSDGFSETQVRMEPNSVVDRLPHTLENSVPIQSYGVVTQNARWAFRSNADKIREFQQWMATQIQGEILAGTQQQLEDAYYRKFIEEGYQKGAGRAFDDTRKAALYDQEGVRDFYAGTKDEFLRSAFANPASVDKLKLLTSRVYTELSGVDAALATGIGRKLAEGFARGENPITIARAMRKELNMSKVQAERIARTEVIRAHAEGQLDAMEKLGVEELGIMVEWDAASTACPLCQDMNGIVLKLSEARGLIPRHPNCTCAYVPANVGENTKGQKRGPQAKAALDDSLRREIPTGRMTKEGRRFKDPETGRFTLTKGRTLEEQREVSKWPGADVKIADKIPQSILDKA